MVLEELGIAFIGAIIGATTTFGFLYKWEVDKKKNELKKIRQIINDDFFRICSTSKNLQNFILSILKNEEDKFEKLTDQVIYDAQRGRYLTSMLDFRQSFLLWNSIVTSGSLVKLQPEEIQLINASHDFIESVIDANVREFENCNKRIERAFDKDVPNTILFIKINLESFLKISYINLNEITKRFDYLCENISWMKSEFSTAKLSELNPTYEPKEEGVLWWLPSPNIEKNDKKTPV